MQSTDDLMKRLDKSMSETLEYGKENDRLRQQNERYQKAVQLLAKLERENPAEFERLTTPPSSSMSNKHPFHK